VLCNAYQDPISHREMGFLFLMIETGGIIKERKRVDNGNICVTIRIKETDYGFSRIFRRKGSQPV